MSTNTQAIPQPQEAQLTTKDGVVITATYYPSKSRSERVILIGSAMAVRQSYYKHFANYMAINGFHVYTFDYRGVAKSQPKKLRGFKATVSDWAMKDLPAMIQHIRQQYPVAQLNYIGHSISGQILGLIPDAHQLDKVMFVASQLGDWRLWPSSQKYKMAFIGHIMLPLTSNLWGYNPFIGVPVPKGVALEWAKWIQTKDYLFGHFPIENYHYQQLQFPLLAYTFTDDTYAPLKPAKALLSKYTKAKLTHKHITPSEVGVQKIDHFGFFRKEFEGVFWGDVVSFFGK